MFVIVCVHVNVFDVISITHPSKAMDVGVKAYVLLVFCETWLHGYM